MKILITGGSGFIGTNLIYFLLSKNIRNFINVDKQKPCQEDLINYWVEANILDTKKLNEIFDDYNPTYVIHLAARTDTSSTNLDDYFDNTEGTRSLLCAIEKSTSVINSIITSTQYVYKSNQTMMPNSEDHFEPHTAYGLSKKITEEYTRDSNMKSGWCIIRPTNVWGPWHMRYPNELLKILDMGIYFHPGGDDPIKSYAYVKNVVHQIYMILIAPLEQVDQQVFYVGDYSINSKDWLNTFSVELTGKTVKVLPRWFLAVVSGIGTYLNKINIKFPLTTLRFQNMIDSYDTPMKKTIDKFGVSHPNLEANVKETIYWIKNEGLQFFPYWMNK